MYVFVYEISGMVKFIFCIELFYNIELYDRPNQPETLEVEPEEEVDRRERPTYFAKWSGKSHQGNEE